MAATTASANIATASAEAPTASVAADRTVAAEGIARTTELKTNRQGMKMNRLILILFFALGAIHAQCGDYTTQQGRCELKMAIAMGAASEDRASNKQTIREMAHGLCNEIFVSPLLSLMLADGNATGAVAILENALQNPDTAGQALIESLGGMTIAELNTFHTAEIELNKYHEMGVIIGALARLAENLARYSTGATSHAASP